MTKARVNLVLMVSVLILAVVNALAIWWTPARGWEFLPEMAHSEAAETLGETDFLPGRTVQQAPISGTVARGFLPVHYGPGDLDRQRAGRELRNPIPTDPEVLKRAKKLFEDFCFPCHGEAGGGNGPVVARGFPAPPSLTGESARTMADGELFHQVTFGRANMPPYRYLLKTRERWMVIRYLRELQEKVNP